MGAGEEDVEADSGRVHMAKSGQRLHLQGAQLFENASLYLKFSSDEG